MRVPIRHEEHWHSLRGPNIGASEVAALFDCGYVSHFQLWHEKRGTLEHPNYSDNERVTLGRCLEAGIAKAASELYGYELHKATDYFTDDECPGLGATPDYFMVRGGKEIPVEVKNASWGSWKDNWIVHEDGFVEQPLRFQLQQQAQLACTGADEGLLIALISGDRLVQCQAMRHDTAIAEIRKRVSEFWASVADGAEPPAEMPQDLDAAKRVWQAGEGKVDLRGDPDVEGWLSQLAELRATRKRIETDEETIQGQVLSYCTRNQFAAIDANGGRVSCKTRAAKPAHTVQFKAQPEKIELRITTR